MLLTDDQRELSRVFTGMLGSLGRRVPDVLCAKDINDTWHFACAHPDAVKSAPMEAA